MTDEIFDRLTKALTPKRLQHSLGVSKTAVMLAKRYGADVEKAHLAGMLHDCARELSNKTLLQSAESFGIVVTDVERLEPVLLHGPVGAHIARRDYGIEDREILRAIACHTTGAAEMSLLDNIIFLADYIEPGRSFPGVDRLRDLAWKNLWDALLAAYNQTLEHLIRKQGLIHPAAVEGRNALLMKSDR